MKRKISSSGLADAIRELKEAKLPDLKERWRALYQSELPHRIRRNLLIRALAYRMQEQALGGLTPTIRRLLAKVAADASARQTIKIPPQLSLQPGAVLMREWHGTQHQVIVRDDGVVFNGKTYKSLSQVAYRITGTKWSGPRFFGLRTDHREQTDAAI